MKIELLQELLAVKLRLLQDAERQQASLLQEMARHCPSGELQERFDQHARETREQLRRLEALRVEPPAGTPHQAIGFRGLVEESRQWMQVPMSPEVLETALLANAFTAEQCEMAAYGQAIQLARQLGLQEAAQVLEQNLAEERRMSQQLAALAEQMIPEEAAAERSSR